MSHIAVRVNGLGKRYRLGGPERTTTLREALVHAVTSPARLFRRRTLASGNGQTHPHIWAVKDVSFEVRSGDVVGLIGRNGAGKSTLLKILSRITDPTEGEAEIEGRVGSLLEVGTGFHPELTGRENIFLNGALLGMRKAEIDSKFKQIVAFSEMEEFLDTPVKRYSSGMFTRLAFAVAAHLEPEILIVDEVLAVGDAAFQKKCLGKMEDVAKEGRTVLFVSHNMAAVQSLCRRAVLLEHGKVVTQGDVQPVIEAYLKSAMAVGSTAIAERTDRAGDGGVRLTGLRIESADREGIVHTGTRLRFTVAYESDRPLQRPSFYLTLCDMGGVGLFRFDNDSVGGLPSVIPAKGEVTCVTDPINLTAGRCYVNVAVSRGGVLEDAVDYATYLDIEAADVYGTGKVPTRETVLCTLGHAWAPG